MEPYDDSLPEILGNNEAVTKELNVRLAQKLKELDAPDELYDFYILRCD